MSRFTFVPLLALATGLAHAEYILDSMSGGTATGTGIASYSNSGNTRTGYGAGSGCSCGGPVTFSWHWNTNAGPAPTSAVVTVTGYAGWSGSPWSGACDDGMNDPASPSSGFYTGQSSGNTHYYVIAGGSTVHWQISPSSSEPAGGSCSVNVTMSISPVTISFAGADGNSPYAGYAPGFLIGQPQIATISCDVGTLSAFQWGVNGPSLFDFANVGQDYSSYSFQPFSWTNQNTCCYSCGTSGHVTASCSASISLPDGSSSTVSASGQETAVVPPEEMELGVATNSSLTATSSSVTLSSGTTPWWAMGFKYTVYYDPDQPFYNDEGPGEFAPVQLVQDSYGYSLNVGSFSWSNGNYQLDGHFPYAPFQTCSVANEEPNPWPWTTDTPQFTVGEPSPPLYITGIWDNFDARMFLVYYAPPTPVGFAYEVPVQENNWSWHSSASLSNGAWGSPAGNAQPGLVLSTGFNDFNWNSVING